MANNKSLPMTLLIAALTLFFVMYSFNTWMDVRDITATVILAAAGLGISYYAIKISKFEMYINKGFLWAGVILILISTFFSWNMLNSNLRPLVVGALLVASIYFGTKFKRYII